MADETQPENDNIRQLRERADQAAKLERENAMLRAGVDLDSKLGQYFANGYKGEMTADAIKAEAEDMPGVLKAAAAPPPPKEEEVNENKGDPNETQERLDLASGSGTPNSDDGKNPYDGAMDDYQAARKDGRTPELASVAAFDKVFSAAVKGDKRVRLDLQ